MRRLTSVLFFGLCNPGLALVELRRYCHISPLHTCFLSHSNLGGIFFSLRFHLICSKRLRHALKHVHESKELEVEDICREPCQIPCNPEASKGYSVRCLSPDAYNPKRVVEMFTEKENNILNPAAGLFSNGSSTHLLFINS